MANPANVLVVASVNLLKVRVLPSDMIGNFAIDDNGHLRQDENGKCIFLSSDNLCRIYATRPKACRDFGYGSHPKCYENPCKLLAMFRC